MTESTETKTNTNFAGTYFERDAILRIANLANIFAWATLFFYTAQVLLSLAVFALQIMRGLVVMGGVTDVIQQVLWIFQPFMPGLWYFIGIQGIGKLLLIFMDIEDNTRRAARK
jgi:hypothetical protein